MIYYLISDSYINIVTFASIIFAFLSTCFAISFFQKMLPRDGGRAFAVNGSKSVGKPRGAGIIFIITFSLNILIFVPFKNEILIYLILVFAAMLSGYLDDSAKTPWGELKKGLIDLIIAIMTAVTYLNFNTNTINVPFTDMTLTLHPILFGVLIVILVWTSINVTNCSDGVDGLCGTLSIVTILTFYGISNKLGANADLEANHMMLVMAICVLAYLWFNASPSKLLMGDAGSRAIGLFIAICALKSQNPILYLLAGFMLIVDGGLGLVKVSLIRVFKINIMKNVRTPIHDHVRKNKNWSDAQVVFRFAILQIIISIATVAMV